MGEGRSTVSALTFIIKSNLLVRYKLKFTCYARLKGKCLWEKNNCNMYLYFMFDF